ncbi:universal stress protein [Stakelama tenebrarum]|uniref:Universal stress protein n=1 Tax=Stakelama tenebrarum TaxID=2711215 RepID=A0A6G6YA56_9SPHN|nr:universal stress protein [Sphingosinithalassobacter tenebrarum]QIG81456.1 universal stress protein [Sphingosinithalassobacter tenebrarum]
MAHAKAILLATDLTARSDRPTDRAMLLGDQLDASVLMLHVVEPGRTDGDAAEQAAREELQAIVDRAGCEAEPLVRSGAVHDEILKLVDARSPSLILTGVARYNNISDYFLGTAVEALVRRAPVPVLVVKARASAPYRRLLFATDFSDCARQALERAAAIFPDAEITVWHGCHAAYEAFLGKEGTELEIQQQADRDMKKFVADADLPASVRDRMTTLVEVGEFYSQLRDCLNDGKFDLLVIGTHGAGGLTRAAIGSRAAEILKYVDSDTLVVRPVRQ